MFSPMARTMFVVTPHDTNEQQFDYLLIGGAGTVTIEPEGASGTFVQCTAPVGYLWCKGRKVRATGTAATLIVGFRT